MLRRGPDRGAATRRSARVSSRPASETGGAGRYPVDCRHTCPERPGACSPSTGLPRRSKPRELPVAQGPHGAGCLRRLNEVSRAVSQHAEREEREEFRALRIVVSLPALRKPPALDRRRRAPPGVPLPRRGRGRLHDRGDLPPPWLPPAPHRHHRAPGGRPGTLTPRRSRGPVPAPFNVAAPRPGAAPPGRAARPGRARLDGRTAPAAAAVRAETPPPDAEVVDAVGVPGLLGVTGRLAQVPYLGERQVHGRGRTGYGCGLRRRPATTRPRRPVRAVPCRTPHLGSHRRTATVPPVRRSPGSTPQVPTRPSHSHPSTWHSSGRHGATVPPPRVQPIKGLEPAGLGRCCWMAPRCRTRALRGLRPSARSARAT